MIFLLINSIMFAIVLLKLKNSSIIKNIVIYIVYIGRKRSRKWPACYEEIARGYNSKYILGFKHIKPLIFLK